MAGTKVTGRCKCGAVRWESDTAPTNVILCHCVNCRRITGQPAVALAEFSAETFRFLGRERTIFESSPGVHRAFCNLCGTPLTWESDSHPDLVEIYLGTFDDPDPYPPRYHTFYGERVAWFDSADTLPRYEGASDTGKPLAHAPADV